MRVWVGGLVFMRCCITLRRTKTNQSELSMDWSATGPIEAELELTDDETGMELTNDETGMELTNDETEMELTNDVVPRDEVWCRMLMILKIATTSNRQCAYVIKLSVHRKHGKDAGYWIGTGH